jgi:hypothetical protein
MGAILVKIVDWFAKGGIATFFAHAGLAVIVFSGIDIFIDEALGYAINSLTGLPSAALQLALLAGVGSFFSIVGSALLTRVALVTAMNSMSIGRAKA